MARSYMFDSKTTENRRKMREEQQVELRQQKKEELLNKKRNLSVSASAISNFIPMKEKLFSSDLEQAHQGVYEFRSLLSVEDSPPIQPVIDSGCVPRFIELMDISFLTSSSMTMGGIPVSSIRQDMPEFSVAMDIINKIRVEAAWVITNISSGTTQQTKVVIDCGAVPLLIQMLLDTNDAVLDQSVWALGNIAGDSEGMRDIILETGALDTVLGLLLKLHESAIHIKIVRNLTWLLSNLNRGRNPPPNEQDMRKSLEVLFKLINIRDPEVVSDAYWALSYIVDVSIQCSDAVLSSGTMSRTYSLLEALTNRLIGISYSAEDAKICLCAISPIIRMIGNIVTGSDDQTSALIQMGFMRFFRPIFYRLENKKQPRLRKEICWTLSNITAGTVEHAKAVVDMDLVPMLIDSMSSYELFIRKEACWAILNLMYHCNNLPTNSDTKFEWLRILMDNGFIDALQSYLDVVPNVPEMQCQILDCFRYALNGGRQWELRYGKNPIYEKIVEADIVDAIEGLQDSGDRTVSDKAYSIIVDFFDGVDN
ncbi:putative armadillo/beta-catenin-like repeat domain-containing protein [Encephalitozoon hellem]|uniref:Importin subunit alpha n=1 Tax=Encephalitozoon hellem TaxID=27973 RepID=A0A9Q9CEK9_ENCHE|nr:importin beta binding domain-containing protein [Encephalitozoon hellem ATCC 50504]AFM99438.1 importin beta binding domain-containing protein [Encephalitozoon hellem ATCC 50504]KAG5859085.1 putative armadillo/beta-catenin-like repeat domain-containing protein [Encephalitozoon hellem]UTX44448.1 importin subunit alpha [Encephalitozoon hellem]WEL39949.1 importin subunit alpha [Encephalitozoon hellem]|eukprot:XP_003888419.1 importin beta binding domain-containing protein [Encephalitozoon hellem ATCC 50504]